MESMSETTVADILAIERVTALYCEVVDMAVRDAAEAARQMQSIFAENITADYGNGPITGRDAVINFLAYDICASRDWLWHAIHTPNIVVEGNQATGSWTVVAMMRVKGESATGSVVGRYRNAFVRTPEGWRISLMRWTTEATL